MKEIFKLAIIVLILGYIGMFLGAKNNTFKKDFISMVDETNKSIIEFTDKFSIYLAGGSTDDDYKLAVLKFKSNFDRINGSMDKLNNPPPELQEIVTEYKSGFTKVHKGLSNNAKYLLGISKDLKENPEFSEGIEQLRQVKEKLNPAEDST